jgi:hypothetical protein
MNTPLRIVLRDVSPVISLDEPTLARLKDVLVRKLNRPGSERLQKRAHEILARPLEELFLYRVAEDYGDRREEIRVIAPITSDVSVGSEVAFEGTAGVIFTHSQRDDTRVDIKFAERIVPFDWTAYWGEAEPPV